MYPCGGKDLHPVFAGDLEAEPEPERRHLQEAGGGGLTHAHCRGAVE